MKQRQRIEKYWSVWIWNSAAPTPTWEPFDEGMKSKRAAEKEKRELTAHYAADGSVFAVFRTTNERCP